MVVRAAGAGRPRDVELDQRIRTAALTVLRSRGPEGVTVEAVAEAARCGKTSIYRRYHNSADILAAALADLAHSADVSLAGRSGEQRLVGALQQFRVGVEEQIGLRGVAAMLSEPQSSFTQLVRRHLLQPRLSAVVDFMEHSAGAGPRQRSDAEALVYALAGSYLARLLVSGQVEPDWAQATVHQLARHWPGLGRPT